ncbi:MAG TPA: CPBP family intramembrane glutamic endopeptidase [Lysobacter sp.]|nr:CPBP family intramembrane glutamic endopeptidase [Lysobacter sp.]
MAGGFPRWRERALLQFALDLLLAVAAMFAFTLLFLFGWALWSMAHGERDSARLLAALQQPAVPVQIAMTVVALALPALLLFAWRRPADAGERRRSLRNAARAATWAWALATGVTVFVLVNLAVALAARSGVAATPSNLALVEGAVRAHPVLLVGFAVGLAPLYEELLFRRVLFGRLWAAGRPRLGMLLSGAAFALFHEPPLLSGHAPVAAALLWGAYGLMGVAFAWVYRRTGTLWAAVAAHAVNNALGCAALFLTAP